MEGEGVEARRHGGTKWKRDVAYGGGVVDWRMASMDVKITHGELVVN